MNTSSRTIINIQKVGPTARESPEKRIFFVQHNIQPLSLGPKPYHLGGEMW
jgi:hypothetical protein